MPIIVYAPNAIADLQRLRAFIAPHNPQAAQKAASIIRKSIRLLATHPQIGRPIDDLPIEYRDLVIPFGGSGYIARYFYDENTVEILAIRHQKELDFDYDEV